MGGGGEKAMEMFCLEIYVFICRIYSRNFTKTEIISLEIGQFSRVLWAKLMEGQHTLCERPAGPTQK